MNESIQRLRECCDESETTEPVCEQRTRGRTSLTGETINCLAVKILNLILNLIVLNF